MIPPFANLGRLNVLSLLKLIPGTALITPIKLFTALIGEFRTFSIVLKTALTTALNTLAIVCPVLSDISTALPKIILKIVTAVFTIEFKIAENICLIPSQAILQFPVNTPFMNVIIPSKTFFIFINVLSIQLSINCKYFTKPS